MSEFCLFELHNQQVCRWLYKQADFQHYWSF